MNRRQVAVALALFLAAGWTAALSPAGELAVGAVKVKAGNGAEFRGAATFPEAFLELERVEGPPVRIRFDRIQRLELKEVKRVEREKESLRAAFYHVERVGGGSGIDGFIRGARPVSFTVRDKAAVRRYVIGTEHPVELVLFTGNTNRHIERPEGNTGDRDFALGRAGKDYTIVVPGNTRWMRTGISLRKDQSVHFTAGGTIKWGTDPVGKEVGPDGRPHAGRQGRPLPGRNLGMLIARIRPVPDKPYGIGSSNDFKTPASGELELGINDDELEDNSGNFRVQIKVDPI